MVTLAGILAVAGILTLALIVAAADAFTKHNGQ